MIHDYHILLENLHGRRFDEARRESIFTEAFEESSYADSIKYCLEAMQEIDPAYAYKAFYVSKKLQDKLAQDLAAHNIKVDFRYQGPIQTETHIMLFGGIELLILQESIGNKPWEQVRKLTAEVMDILTKDQMYSRVDYSDKYRIKVTTSKPTCEIDIIPAIWLNNPEYIKTKREIDRGVIEYNFQKRTQRKYLPFRHIARINAKDSKANGGLKNIVRLLESLKRDSADPIDLTHYEIASLVYSIPDKQLVYDPKHSLSLLGIASAQLNRAVNEKSYIEKLISPSNKELVFGKKEWKRAEVNKLRKNLDGLIADIKSELKEEKQTLYSEMAY